MTRSRWLPMAALAALLLAVLLLLASTTKVAADQDEDFGHIDDEIQVDVDQVDADDMGMDMEMELDMAAEAAQAKVKAGLDSSSQANQFHPLTNIPPPAKGSRSTYFVSNKYRVKAEGDSKFRFVMGKEVSVLGGLYNPGPTNFVIYGVMGSLNHGNQFSKYIQNFSYIPVNRSLAAGEESSFEYSFTPYERLEAQDYFVSLTVFYEDLGYASEDGTQRTGMGPHANTFFNETVLLAEGESEIDNRIFYSATLVTAVMLLVGILSWKTIMSYYRRRSRSTGANVEKGTKRVVDNEWLDQHQKVLESAKAVPQTTGGRVRQTAQLFEK
eukprot:CAMPEP_0184699438 /NCGR_PEP_ID=MMETSP0313-20130426/5707_1 /TAXON_ID=2792 /ORGANISM="Porphyridium aerugineum, Strain SAG 1380-2" /LENGTH=326 /DNA_ID=CAMNT_0027158531 /DNA_START=165 /DNA_END=1148 /DNA_ORIENTATION=-